jgi:hypothetical protein
LITKGVDEEDVADAAYKLFTKEFNKPSTLIGILSTQLENEGITTPVAVSLSNKLKEQQQNRCNLGTN